MKRIVVLGSTGSIGVQTLDVAAQHPDKLEVVGLAAGRQADKLLQQAEHLQQPDLALFENPSGFDIPTGMEALIEMVTREDVDLVVVSVAGVIGLQPTLAAIRAGKQIALASKEVLVAAGELVMPLLAEHGVTMTPIDSEHSAVFQCLQGTRPEQLRRILLTASGGPFRGWSRAQLQNVTAQEALQHPTWNMGGKITVDSATLANKGLEMLEARWLFGVSMDQVEMVVHPQSIVHSMVEFHDGSVLGQMGWPNMRLPIQYALLYPERPPSGLRTWNPVETPALTFEPVDEQVFRMPGLIRAAEAAGGTMPAVMNAANEEAANAFLRGEIGFLAIESGVEHVMAKHQPEVPSLESILEYDEWARRHFREWAALSPSA